MQPGFDSSDEWKNELYGRNDSDYLDQPREEREREDPEYYGDDEEMT